MIKNNVDFCYKKLSSEHRLIQTIPFRFGNRMGSENKILNSFHLSCWCTGCCFYHGYGHPGQSSHLHCYYPLTAYKTIINQRISLKFCHNEFLCHNKVSVENDIIRLFQKEVNDFLRPPILTLRHYVMATMCRVEKHALI